MLSDLENARNKQMLCMKNEKKCERWKALMIWKFVICNMQNLCIIDENENYDEREYWICDDDWRLNEYIAQLICCAVKTST